MREIAFGIVIMWVLLAIILLAGAVWWPEKFAGATWEPKAYKSVSGG